MSEPKKPTEPSAEQPSGQPPVVDAPPPAEQKKGKSAKPKQLKVTSLKDGFCRAGRRWSTTPTTVDADEFSAEQLKALQNEPMLKVEAE